MVLNEEQADALVKIENWLSTRSSKFFVLGGSAGTGKTYTCQELLRGTTKRICFTAPTNKAVKVLRQTLDGIDGRHDFATTYSILGLRMIADGKVKSIRSKAGRARAQDYGLIVVDEGSMVNTVLMEHIANAAYNQDRVQFLFMGDPAQLPPVKESISPIWAMIDSGKAQHAMLTRVMRHDNQILELCTRLRDVVDDDRPKIKVVQAFDEQGGVYTRTADEFRTAIRKHAKFKHGGFVRGTSKVVAWRNATVAMHNAAIRAVIWGDIKERFLYGERVVFAAPVLDGDEIPIAHTDDEGVVTSCIQTRHPNFDFAVLQLQVELDDGTIVTAYVLDEVDRFAFEKHARELLKLAMENSYGWGRFWEFKDAFHDVRYAYAITAHRAQGSTYKMAFVDCRDILVNPNRQEAYKALYVACSRPSTHLILG